jgi:nucleosome assembly protein 1-like 1
MKTFSLLGDMITGRDDEALQHLRDIRMEYLEQPGFALLFEFDENPFFSNKVLRKTYYYREEAGYDGEFVYDHAEGDEINWKSPENNLTVRIEKRKQRNKHTGATRTIEKTYPTESFFTFFSPPVDDEEGDDEDLEALEGQLQLDYEIGEFFKDKLIPHAVDWFTGRALDFEEDGYEDDEELYEDELDEDDDEEESSDDDDDDESGAANTTAKQGEQPSDCKQT